MGHDGAAFAVPVFGRENVRGRMVPTAAGVIVALVVVGSAAVAVALAAGPSPTPAVAGLRLATAPLGFAASACSTTWAGGRAGVPRPPAGARAGPAHTGAVKLFGGAAVAVVAVHAARPSTGVGRLLADGALVALAANLGNLLDRAPGRTTKVALLALVALVVAVGAEPELAGVALVVGAGAGLLPADLGERLMLGDAGANVLGAVLGLGVVVTCGPTARTAVLVVVALLNLVSEQVSFSRVIAAVPPLRALDRWGRLP